MRVLLDTQALLWFVIGDPRLSAVAEAVLSDPDTQLVISPASYWEIAIKIQLGNYRFDRPFSDFFEDAIRTYSLEVLPIDLAHAGGLTTLPLHHRDPFDRMLVSQAMCEDLPIVSSDSAFDAYPITRIW